MRWVRLRALLTGEAGPAIWAAAGVLAVAAVVIPVGLTAAGGTPSAMPTVRVPGDTRPDVLAGTIVRVRKGREAGDLRIAQLAQPDPEDAPFLRCLLQHPAGKRIVNLVLDWTAINLGERGTAPAVHITIRGPGGAAVTAQVATDLYGDLGCRPVRSFALTSLPPHAGEQYSLTLALPPRIPLDRLSVWADGHPVQARLIRVCPKPQCYHEMWDMPPLFTPGSPYSVSLSF